jgi:hypothetical protein
MYRSAALGTLPLRNCKDLYKIEMQDPDLHQREKQNPDLSKRSGSATLTFTVSMIHDIIH